MPKPWESESSFLPMIPFSSEFSYVVRTCFYGFCSYCSFLEDIWDCLLFHCRRSRKLSMDTRGVMVMMLTQTVRRTAMLSIRSAVIRQQRHKPNNYVLSYLTLKGSSRFDVLRILVIIRSECLFTFTDVRMASFWPGDVFLTKQKQIWIGVSRHFALCTSAAISGFHLTKVRYTCTVKWILSGVNETGDNNC